MYRSARFWTALSSALKYCCQVDQTGDAYTKRDLTSVVYESILMEGGANLWFRRRYPSDELALDIIELICVRYDRSVFK